METEFISKGIELFGHYKGKNDKKNHIVTIYQFHNPFLKVQNINGKNMEIVKADSEILINSFNVLDIVKDCFQDKGSKKITQTVDENISSNKDDKTIILNKKKEVSYSNQGFGHYNIGQRNIILIPDFALEYIPLNEKHFEYRLGIKPIHLRYFATPEDKRQPFEDRFEFDRGNTIFRKFIVDEIENLDSKVRNFEYGKEEKPFLPFSEY